MDPMGKGFKFINISHSKTSVSNKVVNNTHTHKKSDTSLIPAVHISSIFMKKTNIAKRYEGFLKIPGSLKRYLKHLTYQPETCQHHQFNSIQSSSTSKKASGCCATNPTDRSGPFPPKFSGHRADVVTPTVR